MIFSSLLLAIIFLSTLGINPKASFDLKELLTISIGPGPYGIFPTHAVSFRGLQTVGINPLGARQCVFAGKILAEVPLPIEFKFNLAGHPNPLLILPYESKEA